MGGGGTGKEVKCVKLHANLSQRRVSCMRGTGRQSVRKRPALAQTAYNSVY